MCVSVFQNCFPILKAFNNQYIYIYINVRVYDVYKKNVNIPLLPPRMTSSSVL